MFRIRRIYDDVLPGNREAIRQVQDILRSCFGAVRAEEIEQLAEKLRNPFKEQFRRVLYVAENSRRRVLGFALVMHEPVLHFSFLDFIASDQRCTGRGIGGALYERVRAEAAALGAKGLFFECPPDSAEAQAKDPKWYRQNIARLRFYEHFGVLPVVGTEYEAPIEPGGECPPHLMFDGLDRGEPLRRDFAHKVVRAILERKYAYLCSPQYTARVVASFRDDPVRLRAPRYAARDKPPLDARRPAVDQVALVVNSQHDIHHVRERGYVEAPVRVKSILNELLPTGLFETVSARRRGERHIRAVHAPDFVDYLKRACAAVPPGKSVYPYVFPIRNAARRPKDLSVRAGYYCIDTFTPLNQNAFLAARGAVDCALAAADELLAGRRFAYALVRPPGHHAERRAFGGFCYFNNAAIAAEFLVRTGRVAILDVDYHHGNGTAEIFYHRADVLTLSIHGHPSFAYPYFSGFEDERGTGPGEGFNVNYPLPESLDGGAYRKTLAKALKRIADFRPMFLIVALGLDPAKGDPTGTWHLLAKDFEANGRMIAELRLPTLAVQEGGYRTRTLGVNARHFFQGLAGSPPRP